MAIVPKRPESPTGAGEVNVLSRREALLTLGLTGLAAVTAACRADNPKPVPPEHPSHDTSQGVVTCDRKKGLIRVVDPKEAQKNPQRYSLNTEDCWEEATPPSNVDPLPPAALASPTGTSPTSK
ncbi:MAG: hypothetical protein HXL03_02500 [Candidatus Nanosynbacter sp.]|nr:hypothetical protein [Candidatus Nanosynbacter sp.]